MPYSDKTFDNEVRELVLREFPDKERTRVVDLGAGAGKYRHLLFDYPKMDAVEAHEPYIERFHLKSLYTTVFTENARRFVEPDFLLRKMMRYRYDLVIVGDMLEHLTPEDAAVLLRDCIGCYVVVVVPFLYEQDAAGGVEWERHCQPDLTPAIMRERYPSLVPLVITKSCGVYVQERDSSRASNRSGRETKEWTVPMAKLQEAKLAICTPVYGGHVSLIYARSMTTTAAQLTAKGIGAELITVQSTIEKARNILVANMLADPSYTHLLFIDSDQGWDVQDVLRCIAFDRDVVGIAARKKVPTPAWAVNFGEGELLLDNGVIECDGLGTGFMLIKRAVLEKMIAAYPELEIRDHDESEAPKGFYYALFQFSLEDGAYRSEDLTFCRRWRKIGGKVHVDPTGDIQHQGEYIFQGAVESLFRGDVREEK